MAESQDSFAYTPQATAGIEAGLSPARLQPYYAVAKGDAAFALQYYLWNARLAKAFLFPLQVAEVGTRNAMYNALAASFGADWLTAQPFALTPESQFSLQRAIDRLPVGAQADDIVAALTFDFWSNLFRREYDPIWTPGTLAATFPHAPAGIARNAIQRMVAPINHLRNRIAHHEPIHRMHHRRELDRIFELVGYCSKEIQDWVQKHSTVMSIVRAPPTSAGSSPGRPLASTNLRPPPLLSLSDNIADALPTVSTARPPLALVEVNGSLEAITITRLTSYISDSSNQEEGMIDLTAHDMAMVLASTSPVQMATVSRDGSTTDATLLFFPPGKKKPRPQVVVVMDDSGKPAGALLRPEIRY